MFYKAIIVVLNLILIITFGCNSYVQGNNTYSSHAVKIITMSSYDPYGSLTRAIQEELRINNIILVNESYNKNMILPLLRIIASSVNQVTASVFQNGVIAEYQIILYVHAHLLMPGKDYYPIDVRVYRSFYNDPFSALAMDAENDILYQEMRQKAAQQLVRKILMIQTVKK